MWPVEYPPSPAARRDGRETGGRRHLGGVTQTRRRGQSGLRIGEAILQVLGPYALTNDPAWDLSDGQMEVLQRASIVNLHPGGTGEIQKVIMARRLGIGRVVRERAGALA